MAIDSAKKERIMKFMEFMGYEYASVQDGSGNSINFVKHLKDNNPDASVLITIKDCSTIDNDHNWIRVKPFSIIGFHLQVSRPGNDDFSVKIDDVDRFHKMTLPIMNAVLKLTGTEV